MECVHDSAGVTSMVHCMLGVLLEPVIDNRDGQSFKGIFALHLARLVDAISPGTLTVNEFGVNDFSRAEDCIVTGLWTL